MTVAVSGSESFMEHEPSEHRPLERRPHQHDGPEGSPEPVTSAHQAEGPSSLSVWTDQSHNCCVLRLSGRLCSETVRLLDSHVDILGCRSCDEVTIDLSTLEDVDPVGARLIVGFGHYVAGRGGRFRVDGASATVQAMIARAEIEISG